MTIEFDPKKHCGGKTRAGTKCRQPKGHRTDHPGKARCSKHGGNTPNGKKAALVEGAVNALRSLKLDDAVDPVASLFEAVRVAAWREQGLRMMLQARPALFGPDHSGDEREDVVSAMHARALKARADIASQAIGAGLDERIVRLAERQGEVIHQIITAALDAAGVSGEARQLAEDAVVRELVAVGPAGDERN